MLSSQSVLHIHVREEDGRGSKRLSKFNELLSGLREAVPDMILQVGGSISFAPEGEGADAKWLSDDTRHMLAELDPKPDQVTIAINTSQMNIMELMTDDDIAGTLLARPEVYDTYREMTVPAGPEWVEEHLRRLQERVPDGACLTLETLMRSVPPADEALAKVGFVPNRQPGQVGLTHHA